MNIERLYEIIEAGEDSRNQFKLLFNSPDALAAEITAFANTNGGRILVGINDDGAIRGINYQEVEQLNQMISNVCLQKIYPPLSVETENIKVDDKVVVIIKVPIGINKLYMANGKNIWVKVGADKRRASREEMRRLLQESFNIFVDEKLLPDTGINNLNMNLVEGLIERKTGEKIEKLSLSTKQLLNNMKLMDEDNCTLAGILLLGKRDDYILSQYIISGVSWYGNDPADTAYMDSEDIIGPVIDLYDKGLSFIKRQLRKIQKGQDFNSLGILEIPEIALQETLVNAIVHRNYYIQSNIRLFIFNDRVEIISPGCLPNTLSVDTIKTGVHISRNPILLSHIKDMARIPYRGIGTGISRIIKSCEEEDIAVDFLNEVEKNQFRVIFWRKNDI